MNTKFTNAIVRRPCPAMVHGITSADLGKPDYAKALEQHTNYVSALKECGLNVTVLEALNDFPDSTFIEDVALCTSKFALVTNPGAPERNGEKSFISEPLQKFFSVIEEINSPGTLDAGDVMMAGNDFFIGISERTNNEGAEQLINILQKYGMTGTKVPLSTMLHLKTGLSYLENNNLLVSGEFISNPAFKNFSRIVVDEKEAYAANSLWVNGKVIVPKGHTNTKVQIENAGYRAIEVDVSEFQKLDGGLSCLSLRF
ncbi:MAG: dimethylarginine dimethylaminohydrolase family protein [Ignavibacteria bacterium]